jgi:hypothetical protein
VKSNEGGVSSATFKLNNLNIT